MNSCEFSQCFYMKLQQITIEVFINCCNCMKEVRCPKRILTLDSRGILSGLCLALYFPGDVNSGEIGVSYLFLGSLSFLQTYHLVKLTKQPPLPSFLLLSVYFV